MNPAEIGIILKYCETTIPFLKEVQKNSDDLNVRRAALDAEVGFLKLQVRLIELKIEDEK